MNIFLIASTEDPAGINIKQNLLRLETWKEHALFQNQITYRLKNTSNIFLITITQRTIYQENLDKIITQKLGITPQLMIFLSRHTSKMKKPTLTIHPIGNYGSAEFGGKPQTLVPTNPYVMTQLLRLLKTYHEKTDLNYQVCFEVTHHGPFLTTPTLYIEVGSTEKEWQKPEPASVIAQAVRNLATSQLDSTLYSSKNPVLVGIGGGHYAPRFSEIVFERNVSFGHMIPAYQVNAGNITREMLISALNLTPDVNSVYIHKNGLTKNQIHRYKKILEDLQISVVSSKDLPLI